MSVDFVKIHRCIIDWEWYDNSKMVHLFIHLLLRANWKKGNYKGVDIQRGQFVTGRKKLSAETGINESSITRCLKRLEDTGEILQQANNKYRIITICNYDKYQSRKEESEQQTNNKRTTNEHNRRSKEVKKTTNSSREHIEFEKFYSQYPKKKNKSTAEKVWNKLKVDQPLFERIITALNEQKKTSDWIKDNGQFIPHPSTWLNQKRWEDEIGEVKSFSCDLCHYNVNERLDCHKEGRKQCHSYRQI